MTINRGAAVRKANVDPFIEKAPDSGGRKGFTCAREEQITLAIAPELLAKVDELADGPKPGRTDQPSDL
jgi:hypothetical protein